MEKGSFGPPNRRGLVENWSQITPYLRSEEGGRRGCSDDSRKGVGMNQGHEQFLGLDANPKAYVDSYFATHLGQRGLDYKTDYFKIGLIDHLLTDYRVLDVGCGTGGYFDLYRGATRVVGIDHSALMVAGARELQKRGVITKNAEFHETTFPQYFSNSLFDCIRLDVYGSYLPLTIPILQKASRLISPGGLVFLSFSWSSWVGAKIRHRKITLGPVRFRRLMRKFPSFRIYIEYWTRRSYNVVLQLV